MEKPNEYKHTMFETGISVPYPYSPIQIMLPDLHALDSTCRRWHLREKLSKRNQKFNRVLKWILLPTFIVCSIFLLVPISIFIFKYNPDISFIFGIMYGVLVFILVNLLNDVIGDLNIITNHYYKHRKFKN